MTRVAVAVAVVDPRTDELRAHDVLAEFYAERLAGILDRMPVERAVLGLFSELVHAAGTGTEVGDLGCGTGRMAPYLVGQGFTPHGVDLSEEMVRVARRDHPGHEFQVGDLRELPFGELARVLKPGAHIAIAYKAGDDSVRRGGETLGLGIGFDIWWHSPAEVERRFRDARFDIVFWGGRPADPDEVQPQGYLVARKR